MIPARQSTALELAIGPVLDADGVAVTGCVVANFKLKKTTGDFAALNGSATLTHVSAGTYDLVLTTSDTDTVGFLTIAIDDTDNACSPVRLQVVEEAVYDALYAASATGALPVSTGGIASTAFAAGAIDAAAIATGAIDADATAADFVTEIRNAITGGAYALDTDANGRMRVVDGTGAGEISLSSGLLDWNPAWDAEVQSEAEDALVAHRLDELLNADSDIDGAAPPTVGSVFHELMSKTAGSFTYDQTTDALEALRDRGDAAWLTATGFSTHSASDVWAVGTRRLTDATNITSTGGTTVPQTGDSYAIVNSGTFGNSALNTDLDALLSRLTSTRAGYLDNLSAGAVATATALDAVDNFVDAEITEILTRIGSPAVSLAADLAALNDLSSAEVQTAAAAALTAYDPPTHAELTSGLASADDATLTAIAALNNLSAAQVNAQVVDALATDTYAEPSQGAPGATISLSAKIAWLYASWRNKKDNDGTTTNLYADNGSTILAKQGTSLSGGTVEKAEWITGA